MIENFSEGYYMASMNVQEYDDGPIIESTLYDFIQSLRDETSSPVIMRVGLDSGPHFEVGYEGAVPMNTLAVPEELAETTGRANVFILKGDRPDTVGVV